MDINLVSHAKDYIDDLARGINPLTKEDVNEQDVINNVKISRCLFYVSDVLGEVIKNGVAPAKKIKKVDFSLEALDLDKIKITEEPISVSVIVKNINEIIPENMKPLKTTAVTSWLVDINMLSVVQINGKNHKRPTKNAEEIGVFQQERQGQYGAYISVMYRREAQKFIVDNLSAIIDGGYNISKRA